MCNFKTIANSTDLPWFNTFRCVSVSTWNIVTWTLSNNRKTRHTVYTLKLDTRITYTQKSLEIFAVKKSMKFPKKMQEMHFCADSCSSLSVFFPLKCSHLWFDFAGFLFYSFSYCVLLCEYFIFYIVSWMETIYSAVDKWMKLWWTNERATTKHQANCPFKSRVTNSRTM